MPPVPDGLLLSEQTLDDLAEYCAIPIGFEVTSRVLVAELSAAGRIVEVPVRPWFKDYDSYPGNLPSDLASKFDVSHWRAFIAREHGVPVGGAIVAPSGDEAVLWDLRVVPAIRGSGIGSALFQHVRHWAKNQDFAKLTAETQDVNVAACRFYQNMGCYLEKVEEHAYAPELDEVRLIWSMTL